MGEFQKAVDDFDEAIRLDPDLALPYIKQGLPFESIEDLRQAAQQIAAYDEAIRLNPDDAAAYYNRGNVYAAVGELARAVENYNETIRLDPVAGPVYGTRAITLTLIGDDELAEKDIDRAVELGIDRKLLEEAVEAAKQQR